MPLFRLLLLLAGILLASARSALSQKPDSVTIVAGLRYQAGGPLGWLTRWVFGTRNRDLWRTPVRVEAIVPDQWRGGIEMIGADTGLRLGYRYYRDSVGEAWTFRAIDRDLSAIIPERFRQAAMSGFFQDLYSARHPGAPLVWPGLARAAGVGLTAERLVAVMDNLPTPGYLEHGIDTRFRMELDDPGAAISSLALLDSLAAPGGPAIDTLRYLRERLFDLYVGSWDPLPQEWLWVRRGDRYVPLPRDRDGAFARFDGLVASLAATGWAELADFGDDYTGKLPVTARTRMLDRRLLTGLDPSQWIPVAMEVRNSLTDSVIAAAVDNLPPEYHERNGETLTRQLRSRRDGLPEAAQRFRLLIMEEADVYGTLGADTVVADFSADSVVRIRITGRVDRSFHLSETKLVRLYLQGGPDQVLIRGSGVLGPMLQLTSYPDMQLVDSSLASRFEVQRDLAAPRFLDAADAPLVRGHRYNLVPWLGFGSDLGLLVGIGLVRTTYDPDWDPWRRRITLRAGYASSPSAFGAELRGDFRFRSSPLSLRLDARATGLEILKFYGYGNESPRTEARDFYRTDQQHLVIAPTLVIPLDSSVTAEVGPIAKRVTTGLDHENLISIVQPYGVTETGFGQLGVQAAFRIDKRDSRVAATRGWLLRLGATAYPALLSVEEVFGSVEGAISGAVTPLRPLTLSARLSGRAAWGEYPVHEAAYLGGSKSVRSLSSQRFAGDAAVWGNFDTRLRLASLPFVVRWDLGILGIADVGRVFYRPEQSRTWHYGLGGGIWAALPDRSFMGLFNVVAGDDGAKFSAGSAFIF